MHAIDVANLTRGDLDEGFVRKAIEKTLQYLEIKGTISLGVAFVGRERMRKLNKDFRGKDQATDVLSFARGGKFVVPANEGEYAGEIIVCVSVVKNQAKSAGVSFQRELAHILIHGTLHLFGYEHEKSQKDTEKMHATEEEIMKRLT